jgi:FKBP-type peptidyl-prolyl cis-trans isomerase SlyD
MSRQTVAKHKAVYLAYSIIDGQGRVFEQCDVPVGYIHGAGSDLFEKIENALEGRCVGDRVEISLAPAEGFGEHRPELTFTDDIENVPPQFRRVGAEIEFENERGEAMLFRVSKIENGRLTIDANHPLAGQTVTFVVTVAAIRAAVPEEIAAGRPADWRG